MIRTNKEIGSLAAVVATTRVFVVKLMTLILYYERDFIIIERVEIYEYTNTRGKR